MAIVNFNSVSGVSTISATSSVTVGTGLTITTSGVVGITSINNGPISGARNRIINGDMRLDQRNSGASVTPIDAQYTLDRYQSWLSQSSKFSVQRSATAPVGFTNSILITSLSALSVGVNDEHGITQKIEGYNISDLNWGTTDAKPVTLSFWVRSSITGNFGGMVGNGSLTRIYPFTYSINATNTWEYKTISIAGETSGTWTKDETWGMAVHFQFGVGSNRTATVGAWSTNSAIRGVTGQTNLLATNGATWNMTGLQLEVGSTATEFERRSYGQELALCQRYFVKLNEPRGRGVANSSTALTRIGGSLPVSMRIAPNISLSGSFNWFDGFNTGLFTTASTTWTTTESYEFDTTSTSGTTVQGRIILLYYNTGSNYSITAFAEL